MQMWMGNRFYPGSPSNSNSSRVMRPQIDRVSSASRCPLDAGRIGCSRLVSTAPLGPIQRLVGPLDDSAQGLAATCSGWIGNSRRVAGRERESRAARLPSPVNAHLLLACLHNQALSEERGIRFIAVSQEDAELLSAVSPGQVREPHRIGDESRRIGERDVAARMAECVV